MCGCVGGECDVCSVCGSVVSVVCVCGVCGDPVREELHMLSEVYQSLVLEIFAWCVVCVCRWCVWGGV